MNNLLIGIALGALLACAVGYLLLRIRVLTPLNRLAELTKRLDELDVGEIRRLASQIDGTPGETARAIASYLESADADTSAKHTSSAAEERYRTQVVDEICRSMLPQPLKENAAIMSFALAGETRPGQRRCCSFYDYFFLEENILCLVVGQVPGSGIAEALFAVVAQTAIRSRLRMGRSLIETMSLVNNQLYDLGGRNTVCALVGVLNTVTGRLAYVNAGGAVPYLMRSEQSYEKLNTPIYAPLGANESVSYRSERMRLNQGDRLFFYTAELGEMTNREGERFSDQELQSALNRSRSRSNSMEELLQLVQDEAASFCEHGNDVLSSSALALEYKKGSSDYVFTLVKGTPEYASVVTEFLRRVLEEGGIPPKDRAGQILLADELFALCCRVCQEGSDIRVACAILPEERALHLRMLAPMGGRDPLQGGETSVEEAAAAYIRTHTRRAVFEAGTDRDMIELVSALPEAGTP